MANLTIKAKGNSYSDHPSSWPSYNVSNSYDGVNWSNFDGVWDLMGFSSGKSIWSNCLKVYPKVIFDYGKYSGYTEFEYVYVQYGGLYNHTVDIYALTNNKTILQKVAFITVNFGNDWENPTATITDVCAPDENYSPETETVN